MTNDDTR